MTRGLSVKRGKDTDTIHILQSQHTAPMPSRFFRATLEPASSLCYQKEGCLFLKETLAQCTLQS